MIQVQYFEQVTSTNDMAKACEAWTLVMADSQTKGRGQRGNSWESAPGDNLTFSLTLEPTFVLAEHQFYISKAVTLALVKTLERFGVAARIKWPNDIYVGDKKICGILIEHDLMGNHIGRSIIGVGLNVNQQHFTSDAPNPTSMCLELGGNLNRQAVLEEFCEWMIEYYNAMAEEDALRIDREYWESLYRSDGVYSYCDERGEFLATISDVLSSGELILRRDDGSLRSYLFKEVSFVL